MKISKNLSLNQKDMQNSKKSNMAKNEINTGNPKEMQAKDLSIKSLLDILFKDLIGKQKSKNMVLEILKEKNILQNIKSTTLELKSAVNEIKNNQIDLKSLHSLDNLLLNIDKMDAKSLQRYIDKSGIFLESKLASNSKEDILNDTKAIFLQIKEEVGAKQDQVFKDIFLKVDKVLANISYYQLASFSVGANILYLPLLWEELEEGQISIKKLKRKRYFCEINLKLKEYGKIDLLIMLFDDININISIFTQNLIFLNSMRENLQILKQGINSVGLVPLNIYLHNSLKDEKIKKEAKRYANNEQTGTGISLHV
ncbi:MAG: hypothetical protein QM482_03170 [Sulfurospirillum sp.]